MVNNQIHRQIDEAEKPFWISYSDLMTALMILFLVVMVVSLTSLSQQAIKIKAEVIPPITPLSTGLSEVKKPEVDQQHKDVELLRLEKIQSVCEELVAGANEKNIDVRVNCSYNKIDFGDAGQFNRGEYKLNQKGEQLLMAIVPVILDVAQSPMGSQWLKRIHIQGFTDTDGSYLYNLNLSLKRSEWVMCKILATTPDNTLKLNAEQRTLVKQLFLAGGVSFNHSRSSKEASRRVELKLEFYDDGNSSANSEVEPAVVFDNDVTERCQI